MVATAAPDKTAEATPTSCQGPKPNVPGGAAARLPMITRPTPVVVTTSAATARGPMGSDKNRAAQNAVKTGAV